MGSFTPSTQLDIPLNETTFFYIICSLEEEKTFVSFMDKNKGILILAICGLWHRARCWKCHQSSLNFSPGQLYT